VTDLATIKAQIKEAFSHGVYPGDWCLINSREGTEPGLLEEEFKGKSDWRTLDPSFIDQAPDGFGTALSFFSDEAFRFYLPAYLIADLDGRLKQANVAFALTHGLDNKSGGRKITLSVTANAHGLNTRATNSRCSMPRRSKRLLVTWGIS
jgi:hypothetical protein